MAEEELKAESVGLDVAIARNSETLNFGEQHP